MESEGIANPQENLNKNFLPRENVDFSTKKEYEISDELTNNFQNVNLNVNMNQDFNGDNKNGDFNATNNNNLFYHNYPYTNSHYKNNHNNYYNNSNTTPHYNQYHGFKRSENSNYYYNNKNNGNSQSEQESEENQNGSNLSLNNQNYSRTNGNSHNGGYYAPKKFNNGSGRGGYYKRTNYYGGHNTSNNTSSYNNSYYGGYPKKKKPFVYNLRWDGYDPFTVKNLIYRAEIYIMSKYPNLAQVNATSEGLSQRIAENSKFFVIKSFNEEDVHKAIKYSLWSSTKAGNKTLNEAFNSSKEQGGSVYLFFSCNGSGRYIGVARMLSEVNETKEFNYWTQDAKWQGLFDVEWVFIKDIPFKSFKMINILMNDGLVKPLSNARDTQEIPFAEAKIMLETFENYTNTNSILEQFEFYDLRQENYEKLYL